MLFDIESMGLRKKIILYSKNKMRREEKIYSLQGNTCIEMSREASDDTEKNKKVLEKSTNQKINLGKFFL
jgi:hypothetical protein